MLPGQEKALKAHHARLKSGETLRTSLALFYEEAFQVGQGQLAAAMREARDRCPQCGSQRANVPGDKFNECCNGLNEHFKTCRTGQKAQKQPQETGK